MKLSTLVTRHPCLSVLPRQHAATQHATTPAEIASLASYLSGTAARPPALLTWLTLFAAETEHQAMLAKFIDKRADSLDVDLSMKALHRERMRVAFDFHPAGTKPRDIDVEILGGVGGVAMTLRRHWQATELVWRWGERHEVPSVVRHKEQGGPAPECFEVDAGEWVIPPLSREEWGAILAMLRGVVSWVRTDVKRREKRSGIQVELVAAMASRAADN